MDDFNSTVFGAEDFGSLEQLRKALEVGYETNTTSKTGWGATRIESLDSTLKIMTNDEKTAKFWAAVKKDKAYSTNEEFTTVEELGGANFYAEGGISEETNEILKREYQKVKYLGTLGKIPNVVMETKQIVSALEQLSKMKTQAMIKALDVKLFFGNEGNVPTEFNGLLQQFNARVKNPTQNVIDLRGKCLTPEILNEIGLIIQENAGDPGNIKGWLSPRSFKGYKDELMKNRRFLVNDPINSLSVDASKFDLDDTKGQIVTDLFLRHKGETFLERRHPKLTAAGNAFAATSDKAPKTLDALSFTCTVEAGVAGQLEAATYDYCAVPINSYGAGAGFEVKGVVCAADKKVTFALSDNGSPASQAATAFEIYRKVASKTALTDYEFLCTIAATAATKVDNGEHIPGTHYGFFLDWDFDQVFTFKQLLPFMRTPLAVVDDSQRFFYKLYGTPILYNPNKVVVLKNVGTIPNS